MSALMMGLVWEHPIGGEFGHTEKYVLLAYADHADQNGKNIFPSIDLIAQKTGYSERSVQTITRELEKMGFLVADGMGKNGTNRWIIPLQRGEGGAKIAPVPMSQIAPEGIAPEGIAPEPSVEVKKLTTTTASGAIFEIFQAEIGLLTPMTADAIQDAEETFSQEWIVEAIHEAAMSNKRNWKYVLAILKRWKAEGYKSPRMQLPAEQKIKIKPMNSSNQDIIRKVAANG